MRGRPTRSYSVALAVTPGTLLAGMAGGVAFPILPIAGARLGLPLWFIGVVLAANRATRVVVSPAVGYAVDRFGGRRVMLAGMLLMIVVMAMFAAGITTGHAGPLFLGGRLVHGVASSCVFVGAQTLALHHTAGGPGATATGRTAGTVRTAIILGVPLGLLAGGLLADRVGDVATFELGAVAAAIATVATLALAPDLRTPARERPRFMDTLRAMRDRRLAAIGALNFAMSFTAGGMVITTVALLVHERGIVVLGRGEQGSAALLMGWLTIVEAIATPSSGRLGDRLDAHATIAAVGLCTMVPGLLVVALTTGTAGLATGLALIGIGAAGLGPSLLALLGELVTRERRGVGVGLLQLFGDLGGMLGPLVGTAVLASSTSLPYLGTAALCLGFIPVAVWLVRARSTGR